MAIRSSVDLDTCILYLNNSYLFYKSHDSDNYDSLIRIPKRIRLNKWNSLKLEYSNHEVLLGLNGNFYKTFSKNNIGKAKILNLGKINFKNNHLSSNYSAFKGSMSNLSINSKKIEMEDEAIINKNIKWTTNCSNKKCGENGICISKQNEIGFKCHCFESVWNGTNCEK